MNNSKTVCNAQIITLETQNLFLPCIVMTHKLTQGTRDLFFPAYLNHVVFSTLKLFTSYLVCYFISVVK